jgi:hypothetical protein
MFNEHAPVADNLRLLKEAIVQLAAEKESG